MRTIQVALLHKFGPTDRAEVREPREPAGEGRGWSLVKSEILEAGVGSLWENRLLGADYYGPRVHWRIWRGVARGEYDGIDVQVPVSEHASLSEIERTILDFERKL